MSSNSHSKKWAVVIGISKYKHSEENGLDSLVFADEDARSFSRALRNMDWSKNHIKLFTNQEATKRNIQILNFRG